MSKENTECDVRVALYDGTKNQIAHVMFFNDCELLLECTRVTVVRDGNRLYFHKGDAVKGSIKFSGKDAKNILQLWSGYSKVRDLEGKYDLKYDKEHDLYYIDKTEKLDEYNHHIIHKGIKQLNHNPGNREKRGETTMAPVTIKVKGQKAIEVAQKQKKENSKNVVVKALVELLKTQVKGNDEALSTIDALEKFI